MYTQTHDVLCHYEGVNGRPSVCRLDVWEQAGQPPLFLFTELAEDQDASLLNSIATLAASLIGHYTPVVFELIDETAFHVVTRYPPERHPQGCCEGLCLVTFQYGAPHIQDRQLTLGRATHRRIPRGVLEELLGRPYPAPERAGALPLLCHATVEGR